jgi:hypothetical protein
MYLAPDIEYCIVAYKPNEGLGEEFPAYGPGCQTVTNVEVNSYDNIVNFVLSGSDAGNLLAPIVPDTSDVRLSVRDASPIPCSDSGTCDQVEVYGETVPAEGGAYTATIGLPVLSDDNYEVVVSDGIDTYTEPANPIAYTETIIGPFAFPKP